MINGHPEYVVCQIVHKCFYKSQNSKDSIPNIFLFKDFQGYIGQFIVLLILISVQEQGCQSLSQKTSLSQPEF